MWPHSGQWTLRTLPWWPTCSLLPHSLAPGNIESHERDGRAMRWKEVRPLNCHPLIRYIGFINYGHEDETSNQACVHLSVLVLKQQWFLNWNNDLCHFSAKLEHQSTHWDVFLITRCTGHWLPPSLGKRWRRNFHLSGTRGFSAFLPRLSVASVSDTART